MKINSQKILKIVKEYLVMTLAGVLNAISLFTFVNPATLIAGGFSGLSSALTYIFVLFIDMDYDSLMSLVYLVLNIPLLICAVILLRGDFTAKTIWSTIVSTVTLAILPEPFKFHDSRLISVIFGGLLIGIAMYIAYESNGSNGGTEIIARIFSKYRPELDISSIILIFNFVITLSGSIVVMVVVPNQHVDVIIYSFLYVLIGGSSLGMFKRGFNHPQKFLIITSQAEAISQEITKHFKRGFSWVSMENSFDGQERKIISVIVQYRQMTTLKRIIRKCDPHAFTIIKDISEVFYRPFNRSYKTE